MDVCEFHRSLQSSYDRIELVLVWCAHLLAKMIPVPETSVCWCEFHSIIRNIVIVLLSYLWYFVITTFAAEFRLVTDGVVAAKSFTIKSFLLQKSEFFFEEPRISRVMYHVLRAKNSGDKPFWCIRHKASNTDVEAHMFSFRFHISSNTSRQFFFSMCNVEERWALLQLFQIVEISKSINNYR